MFTRSLLDTVKKIQNYRLLSSKILSRCLLLRINNGIQINHRVVGFFTMPYQFLQPCLNTGKSRSINWQRVPTGQHNVVSKMMHRLSSRRLFLLFQISYTIPYCNPKGFPYDSLSWARLLNRSSTAEGTDFHLKYKFRTTEYRKPTHRFAMYILDGSRIPVRAT